MSTTTAHAFAALTLDPVLRSRAALDAALLARATATARTIGADLAAARRAADHYGAHRAAAALVALPVDALAAALPADLDAARLDLDRVTLTPPALDAADPAAYWADALDADAAALRVRVADAADLDARADLDDDAADLDDRIARKSAETPWSLADVRDRRWLADDGTEIDRPGADRRPEPTETVGWTRADGSPIGATLAAPIDGPGAAALDLDAHAAGRAAAAALDLDPVDLDRSDLDAAADRLPALRADARRRAAALTAARAALDPFATGPTALAYNLTRTAAADRSRADAATGPTAAILDARADATADRLAAARADLDARTLAALDRATARYRKAARADAAARSRVDRWTRTAARHRAALDAAGTYGARATAYRATAHRDNAARVDAYGRRLLGPAVEGTGHAAKTDQTPPVTARGSWPARTTARRADAGVSVRAALDLDALRATGAARATAAADLDAADLARTARLAATGRRLDRLPPKVRRSALDLLARVDAAAAPTPTGTHRAALDVLADAPTATGTRADALTSDAAAARHRAMLAAQPAALDLGRLSAAYTALSRAEVARVALDAARDHYAAHRAAAAILADLDRATAADLAALDAARVDLAALATARAADRLDAAHALAADALDLDAHRVPPTAAGPVLDRLTAAGKRRIGPGRSRAAADALDARAAHRAALDAAARADLAAGTIGGPVLDAL